jgi:hypothetical protein
MGSKSRSKATSDMRLAYACKAETKLIETTARLDGIKTKLERATADGHLDISESLRRAQRQAEAELVNYHRRLENLKSAGEDSWMAAKAELEDAQEDLARSLKNIMARLI